jgi:hypothetical protein
VDIHLKPFALTRGEYVKITLIEVAKGRWFVVPAAVAVVVAGVFVEDSSVTLLGAILVPIYIVTTLLNCWRNAASKQNRNYFMEKTIRITDDCIEIQMGENFSRLSLDSIARVVRTPRYYLLYLSRNAYSYIPAEAFPSEADREAFDGLLREKKLL